MPAQDDYSDEFDDDLFDRPDESYVSTGFVSRDKIEAIAYAKRLEDEFSIRSEIELDPRHSNETVWEQWIVMAKSMDVGAFLEEREFQHFDNSPRAFFDQGIEGAIFKGPFDLIEGLLHLGIESECNSGMQFVLYPYDWDTNRWQVLEMSREISYSDLRETTIEYEEAEEIMWPWDTGEDEWARPLDADEDGDLD